MEMANVDVAGVGIGPFNLGLAALLSRHSDIRGVPGAQAGVSLA